ncbi:MAG: ParA family protein [Hyphomonadaceae bacterium]|nr:ParA family protein [Hyphomonadaceae bacterium]
MEGVTDQGIISVILERFDPQFRPTLEAAALLVLVGGVVATAINPIIDLAFKVWRFFSWLWKTSTGWIQATFFPPPPAPDLPSPMREIPEERTVWETRRPLQPVFPNSQGIPIITIANMKGGVGKTTIAANLAVCFRDKFNKPILLIDFDYQGSLSQSVRGEAGYTDPDITADILISPESASIDPPMYAREMRRDLENISIYPTTYPFATIENNLLATWLSSPSSDMMYRLCALLKLPAFQGKYGAVIIDCPPRLTMGSINALCASTHLLVPTTLDDMSGQAAEYFLAQISRMSESVFPKLKVIGIVPTIVYQDGNTLIGEKRTRERLTNYGKAVWKRDDFVLVDGAVPRLADISNYAGSGVASVRKRNVRQIFEKLAAEVEKRL